MSMWQCKKWPPTVPENYKYLGKLLILSSSLHIIFLFTILVLYQINHPSRFNIVINQRMNHAKIVFVPTIKTMPGNLSLLAQTQINQQPRKIAQLVPITKVEKKSAVKKTQPLHQKQHPSKTIIIKKEKPQPRKAVPKVQKQKPKASEQKVEQKKMENPKLQVPKKIESQPLEKISNDVLDDIIYLGRGDKVLLDIHNQVQIEIEKVWHPPVGLAKDLVCAIKVTLDKKGSILDLALEESSKVISYDITARTALDMISFPKSLWGKEVVITFKQ